MTYLPGLSQPAPPTVVAWSSDMTAYNFGPGHPMAPERMDLTARLAGSLGLFGLDHVVVEAPEVADDAALESVHSADFVAAVRRVSANPAEPDEARGLGTEDDPAFAGMHEAAARLAGGSLLSASRILDGSALHAVNFGGGMHHAARERASGFCIYNDAALAVQKLLDGGISKVAYIDVDAHHGDGTESIFWNDPRVLTISLHESGLTLFPGTGFANEIGGPQAEGTAVNVALPSGTGDAGWLRAFHAVVPQLVAAFQPEVIVSQHGCDSHRTDPLTHLNLSVDGQREAASAVGSLAARHCDNRWIATGGGGYNVTDVVPRSWSHLIAIASGRPVPLRTPVPEDWRAYVLAKFGRDAPLLMGDDVELWWRSWEVGFDPNDAVDRTVMATRKAVFPLHGLDPWFD
ncbi:MULTISPECIES: acetoin utilization protein AcuC [Micrococcaceae]|uniref:acetoin utilization protein AcuC n=1 Tax=Micrococcaceae TaxID=1268 RepID=UPI0012FCC6DD|nr:MULTISPECIES: acetoin utilization protein AcuC [Pseudarthrobacter]MEA3550056.1 acetoin utilization protein AcuC [Pseudarthrobacter sp. C1]MUU72243.1 acetoin utilization protein AcuC [Pseudarthrobacter sp. GA104]WPU08762.1 acetoin utilization protein AcuC [Pseudarthrobacter oxydans]HET7782049.1 acetoin utilization protein AcuC [Arthrobacter sp.]